MPRRLQILDTCNICSPHQKDLLIARLPQAPAGGRGAGTAEAVAMIGPMAGTVAVNDRLIRPVGRGTDKQAHIAQQSSSAR
jgi:hypothetical protein